MIWLLRGSYWTIVRPDAVAALHNETFKKVLSWYYSIFINDYPAKFHIAKAIPLPRDSKLTEDLDVLWDIHNQLTKDFNSLWNEVKRNGIKFNEFKKLYGEENTSLLDLDIEIAMKIVKSCRFCEWKCRIDRTSTNKGVCRLNTASYVHSWFLHIGEEAPLVPSGTIFYGSCNFRCVFCQNWDISQENPYNGAEVDPRILSIIQKELKANNARNINHVGGEPTPNLHNILASLKHLDVNIPQLWNSNFYMSEEAMKLLSHVIDIWLPDFKYGNNECALKLSKVSRYMEIITRNLKIAIEWGDMIIRHLVLPNHIECCSKPVLKWISDNIPKERVVVNIMDQYRPEYKAYEYKDISRKPTLQELEEVYRYADSLKILWREIS
uniref:Radical SAM protein n=1 Tax=Ignisphaera aggregans TaxID=334771 RepID=A0A7C5XNP0_9CREN